MAELYFSSQDYYNQRCSLVDIVREWEREGLPLEICPPLLEELLLLKFPQYKDNLKMQIEFFGRKADTLQDYVVKLIDLERSFYRRGRGQAAAEKR